MMTTVNNSYHLLYKQALVDPSCMTEDDLLGLLLRYPYSQPLIFAYERRKRLVKEESNNKDLALIYANSEGWLWNYVNKPVEVVPEIIPEEEEYIPYEEEFAEENSTITMGDEEKNVSTLEDEEHEELEKLVHGGSMGNYFVFDAYEKIEDVNVSADSEGVSVADDSKDDISLYNDDLMPYSFRWWLHKTRLEHADTYQPYAVANYPLSSQPSSINFEKLDVAILDQQIKENIINFQNPEEKLSEEVKSKPIVPVPPKKSSEIIEKFIQKDPIIQPPSPENINNENMARQSAEDNYVLVTETLANIYIDQALYLKAIEVFKKLILKYPEKKSYFATRIQELEKNL